MRKAVIGMMQQAVLAGMESGISEALGQEAEPGGYHDALVYSAMIHAGVGGFVVPGHRQGEVAPDLPLTWNGTSEIRSKCDYVDDEYFQLHQFFMDLLWSNALEKVEADKSFYQLALFLTDLSFAMANSTAIVSVFDFPNPKNYYGHLNLRLVMALERLVNGVTPLSLDLIIPTFEVDQKIVLYSWMFWILHPIKSMRCCMHKLTLG